MKAIVNSRLIVPGVDGHFSLQEKKVILFDEKIRDIVTEEEFEARRIQVGEVIDANGRYAGPGFVNVHIHGCNGDDAMDFDDEAVVRMARFLAGTGVTSFLPTTMSYDMPRIYLALDNIRGAMDCQEGARVLGAHMEGPFINPRFKGAQSEENIIEADFSLLEDYLDVLRIVTIAPEVQPDDSFADSCHQAGIVVSVGHTDIDYDRAISVIKDHGVNHFTHLYNGMNRLQPRKPGAVGAALDTDAFCELITDNIHIAPSVQRLVHRLKGLGQVVLITDSMRACGLEDGLSELGGQKVWVKGPLAQLEDGTIAGSVITMDKAILNYSQNIGLPVYKALEAATLTPAKSIGEQENIGSLEPGKLADIVLFDDDVRVSTTIRDGRVVFSV